MAKETKKPAEEAKPKARGLFSVAKEVASVVDNDVNRFQLEEGANKCRILTAPVLTWKHWDLPESAEAKVVPCAKYIGNRMAEFAEDPDKVEASLPDCPYCLLEDEFGDGALGKEKGFYNRRNHYTVNVLDSKDGKVKLWDINQKSVMKALMAFENDPEWAALMPNGLIDREIIVTKTVENKKTSYTVGGAPISGPLSEEELAKVMAKVHDVGTMSAPPDITTEDGKEAFDDLLKKNGQPKQKDRPKKMGK